MSHVTFPNRNGQGITMAAIVHFPPHFDERKQYPAVVVSHPGGGVKEQTAGLYASKLAEQGLVAIAFDRSYQGESSGEPRQLENPHVSTEDVSAVVDYLTTLPYVDENRIGAMGICAGAGYSANAAIQDRRIKALGMVSAVNIGQMFRNGWDNSVKDADAMGYLAFGSQARTADATGSGYATIPLAPLREEDAPNEELREAWEYYHTPRCEHPNAPGFALTRNLNQIITYDAYHKAEAFLTQPILAVAGSVAGSKWMSDDLLARAASTDKTLHVVEGANHMSLYDVPHYVDEAVAKLAPFFLRTLN
ncbi:alpha/beta hydrolase [Aeromonas dhakensis]|uniref:alpha/beta hydrolase n=1 Tax=Aeromonas dhakensis TaxID=196024 RepID=UPI0019801C6C|nr:alpha/beta hydrolase [Aeromonas dhakensis]MBW3731115.1 alpha/beta hydrolase [Aeromonas dhakensis]QSR55758.1 alpha/beta fold hydrolase [Aeromonas dhakensis]